MIDLSAPLRVAMLGGGLRSAIGRTHVTAMRLDGAFELVAGCFSRSDEVNRATAAAYGVSPGRTHADLGALLDDVEDIDVLVIATPIDQHADQIAAAMARGVVVITDKPTAHSAAAVQRLVEADSATRRRLYTLFNYTGYPAVRELRARVQRGDLGRLVRIVAEMPQDSYLRLANAGATDAIQDWRLRDGTSAGVSLDLYVHLHSLVRFLTDAPAVDVIARSRSVAQAAPGLIDDVDALIEHEGGLWVSAWYGKAALGSANGLRLRVFGERGAMTWRQDRPEELALHDGASRSSLLDRASMDAHTTPSGRYDRFKPGHPSGFLEAFANSYGDIAAAIRGTEDDLVLGGDVAVEALAVCEAIARSSAGDGTRTAVTLPS